MSETVPEDIREKAAAAHAQFADSRVEINLGDIIARALLAHEREVIERCAKVAENAAEAADSLRLAAFPAPRSSFYGALEGGAICIAAAIRETAR